MMVVDRHTVRPHSTYEGPSDENLSKGAGASPSQMRSRAMAWFGGEHMLVSYTTQHALHSYAMLAIGSVTYPFQVETG